MNDYPTPEQEPLEPTDSEKKLIKGLRSNPLMAKQINGLMAEFDDDIASGMSADEAEERFVLALQQLGQAMMHQWAENTQREAIRQAEEETPGLVAHSKKKLHWQTTLGTVSIQQHILRNGRRGNHRIHPFRDSAQVTNKGCSRLLRRRIVDFSAERSFARTAEALGEHYNITVSLHAIDNITREVAVAAKCHNASQPPGVRPAEVLVSGTDGSMLPIVSTGATDGSPCPDKRKHRECHWKELRVSTASTPDTADTYYGVALGEPLIIGCMMHETCRFKGMGKDTRIHAVADGARWICEQYSLHFGTQCQFLLDFYHACEYLAGAVNSTGMDATQCQAWLEKRKHQLRESQTEAVLAALRGIMPPGAEADNEHPVTTALNYLQKRHALGQLDYKAAIQQGLPIGSGEVESAHRHILQKRLKIPGAWWKLQRAEEMAQLRALRANNRWKEFWQKNAA